MVLLLVFLAFYSRLSNSQCPTTTWTYCAISTSDESENYCTVRGVNQTTVAYGNPTTGKWSFTDVSLENLVSLQLLCSGDSFGDITSYPQYCCYYPTGSILADHLHGAQEYSTNWKNLGSQGDFNLFLPTSGQPYWIRYGSNTIGKYVYRLMENSFDCNDETLGEIEESGSFSNKPCDYFIYPYNLTNYEYCGSETTETCDFTVSQAVVPPIIRVVKYGNPDDNQFYYRFVYSTSQSVRCDDDLFDDADTTDLNQQCHILWANESNYFSYNLGYWYLAKSCIGCNSLSYTLYSGVDSNSDYAATSDWAVSYMDSISVSLRFANTQTNEQEDLSYSTASSIASDMSSSLRSIQSRNCAASCSTSTTGNFYIYQWITTSYEQIDIERTRFTAYQCDYICKSNSYPPVCPYGYCANDDCTLCNSY